MTNFPAAPSSGTGTGPTMQSQVHNSILGTLGLATGGAVPPALYKKGKHVRFAEGGPVKTGSHKGHAESGAQTEKVMKGAAAAKHSGHDGAGTRQVMFGTAGAKCGHHTGAGTRETMNGKAAAKR